MSPQSWFGQMTNLTKIRLTSGLQITRLHISTCMFISPPDLSLSLILCWSVLLSLLSSWAGEGLQPNCQRVLAGRPLSRLHCWKIVNWHHFGWHHFMSDARWPHIYMYVLHLTTKSEEATQFSLIYYSHLHGGALPHLPCSCRSVSYLLACNWLASSNQ